MVADFRADLPPEWETFLADAALAGTLVYQVKTLKESLTGRVEIDHLSENSFGSLLPTKGYFHLKEVLDWLVALAALPVVLPVLLEPRSRSSWTTVERSSSGSGGSATAGAAFSSEAANDACRRANAERFEVASDDGGARPPDHPRRGAPQAQPNRRASSGLQHLARPDELDRPPPAEPLSEYYEGNIAFYRYRHVVKPRISGWAQVSHGQVTEDGAMREKQTYDFYYIKYFSPWLGLLILFKTVRTIMNGFGAR